MRTVPERAVEPVSQEAEARPAPTPTRRRRWSSSWSTGPRGGGGLALASRVVGSAAIALGLSDALNRWFLTGKPLEENTDVIGYPTYANFNVHHYMQMFVVAVVVFPVVMVTSYVVFDRVVPRLVARHGSTRVVAGAGVAGRIVVPGVAVGLIVAIAFQTSGRAIWPVLALGIAGYAAAVALGALALGARRPARSYARRLALANMALVPVTVLGLAVVSVATSMTVIDTDRVVSYSFVPWPLVVLATLVVGAAIFRAARRVARGPLEDLRAAEFNTVSLVAGSVIVFLTTAVLPSALGYMDAFHEGEGLGTATLLRDGHFPWRDVLFIHGPLLDGLWPWLGLSVFGDSRWGMDAGWHVLVEPLCYVLVFVLLALVTRRNWVVLAGFPVLLLAGSKFFGGTLLIGQQAPRLAFLPVLVLLLVRTLSVNDWRWSMATGVAAFTAMILTPELSFFVLALAIVVVGFDLVTGRGLPLFRRFGRALWVAAGGLAAALVLAAWLAVNGAIDDFFFYFTTFAVDHTLKGAFPVDLATNGTNFIFAAALPFALAVLTGGFFAWRLATRKAIRPADWAMASLALLGLFIYPKFLARADNHVLLGVVIGFPLMVYIVARILEPGDVDVERANPGRAPRHLLSAAVIGALLITAVPSAVRQVQKLPDNFTPVSQTEAQGRLGYATDGAVPTGLLDDLQVALDAVGPDATLFDFTNQPAVVYYLMGLEPTTRYFHVSMAIREVVQADVIDELKADPPDLVMYWSLLGLPQWDGIVNPVRHYDISQWILERYRPWLSVHGELLYVRNDLDVPDAASLAPDMVADPIGDDLSSLLPTCGWGSSPAFLDAEDQVGTDGPVITTTPAVDQVQFAGWAGPIGGERATRVLAVGPGGRVIGEGVADLPRADLEAVAPDATMSGFAMGVPLVEGESAGDVRLVAVTASGKAAMLGDMAPLPAGTELRYSEGRTAVLEPGPGVGAIDGSILTGLPEGTQVLRLDIPAGAIEDHDWLEMSVDGDPVAANFLLTDTFGRPSTGANGGLVGQGISFATVAQPGDRYLVQGASCGQWRGLDGGTAYLQAGVSGDITLQLQSSLDPPG